MDGKKAEAIQLQTEVLELKGEADAELRLLRADAQNVKLIKVEIQEARQAKETAEALNLQLKADLDIKIQEAANQQLLAEEKIRLLMAELANLKAESQIASVLRADVTRLEAELEEKSQLQITELACLKGEAADAQALRIEIEQLQRQIIDLKSYQADLVRSQTEVSELKMKLTEMQAVISSAEVENLELRSFKAKIGDSEAQQQIEIAELKGKAADAQFLRSEVSRLQAEVTTLMGLKEDANASKVYRDEVMRLQSVVADLRAKVAVAQAQEKSLEETKQKYSDTKQELETLKASINYSKIGLRTEELKVEGQYTMLEAEIQRLKSANTQSEGEMIRLEQEKRVIRDDLEQARARIEVAEAKAFQMEKRALAAETEMRIRSPSKQVALPEPEPTSPQSIDMSSASSIGKKQFGSVDVEFRKMVSSAAAYKDKDTPDLTRAEMDAWRRRQKEAADLARFEATNWQSKTRPIANTTEVVEVKEEIVVEVKEEFGGNSKLKEAKTSLEAFRKDLERSRSPSAATDSSMGPRMQSASRILQRDEVKGYSSTSTSPAGTEFAKRPEIAAVDLEFAKMVKGMGGRGAVALKVESYSQKNLSNGNSLAGKEALDESDTWRRQKLEALSKGQVEVDLVEQNLKSKSEVAAEEVLSNDDLLRKFADSGPAPLRKGTDFDRTTSVVEVESLLAEGPSLGAASVRLLVADRNEAHAQAEHQ
eukprot:gnl/MRDRNA2_/MRDRNA2_21557_c0_seq1.p1 gnl/MRDRNA2_/MRDRNA2_21557_c0~~gnl/MRDRNA2_/MRDRNA2_21557_c0_seq1.p1  ORF type:complete len:711 (+),score=230.89 gnl/MRDRNA2_/MRDRNA2_21557_c0_seq1:3-2135(+)